MQSAINDPNSQAFANASKNTLAQQIEWPDTNINFSLSPLSFDDSNNNGASAYYNTLEQPIFRSLEPSATLYRSTPADPLASASGSASGLDRLSLSNGNYDYLPTQSEKLELPTPSLINFNNRNKLEFLDLQIIPQSQTANNTTVSSTSTVSVSSGSAPVCPSFVHRSSSFITVPQVDSLKLLSTLKKEIQALNIECTENSQKHKLKCINFCPVGMQKFCVRVYACNEDFKKEAKITNNDNKNLNYVVELQKRSGCSMAFNYLYKMLRERLTNIIAFDLTKDNFYATKDDSYITTDKDLPIPPLISSISAPPSLNASSASASALTCPAPIKISEMEFNNFTSMDCSSFKSLFRMMNSLSDEAALTLANMHSDTFIKALFDNISECSKCPISFCSLNVLLQKLLSSNNLELVRNGALLFSKCCDENAYIDHLISDHNKCQESSRICSFEMFHILFKVLDLPNELSSFNYILQRDIKRSIVAAIEKITKKNNSRDFFINNIIHGLSPNNLDYMAILNKLNENNNNVQRDERLVNNLQSTLTRLVY